jgi:hypothetical protein
MALTEGIVKQAAAETPKGYGRRVTGLAVVYFFLNLLSMAIVSLILWRAKHLVTLSQRSNVETLTLLILFALSLNYLVTTFKGFLGAIQMAVRNFPYLAGSDDAKVEKRKHEALRESDEPKVVYLDQLVGAKEDPGRELEWKVGDDAGQLGTLVIRGLEVRFHPVRGNLSNAFFEFVVTQIEHILQRQDPHARLHIAQWGTIDEDGAAAYNANAQAFQNLEAQLGKGPIWPRVTLTAAERDEIAHRLRDIVPALRNESYLPDVEYEAKWNVPVLPEPLGFVQLERSDNRADPIATMGCAAIVMLVALVVLIFLIAMPPWVPSK